MSRLSAETKLDLYLVEEGLREAALISVGNSLELYLRDGIGSYKEDYIETEDGKLVYEKTYEPDMEYLDDVETEIKSRDVLSRSSHTWVLNDLKYHRFNIYHMGFSIASNRVSLFNLERALNSAKVGSREYHKNLGDALDYPAEDIEAFVEGRTNSLLLDRYLKVINYGRSEKEIPDWLCYLSFIPSFSDEGFSRRAKELGIRYRDYVRKNNPELSREVESNAISLYGGLVK